MESLRPAVTRLDGTCTAARHSTCRAGRNPGRDPISEDFPGGPDRLRNLPSVVSPFIFACTSVLTPLKLGYLDITYRPQFFLFDQINHYANMTRLVTGGSPNSARASSLPASISCSDTGNTR